MARNPFEVDHGELLGVEVFSKSGETNLTESDMVETVKFMLKKMKLKSDLNLRVTSVPEYKTLENFLSNQNVLPRSLGCKALYLLLDCGYLTNKEALDSLRTALHVNPQETTLQTYLAVLEECIRNEDKIFIKNELPTFLKTIQMVLNKNESAICSVISFFETQNVDLIMMYKPILKNIVLYKHQFRGLVWNKLVKKMSTPIVHYFLLWLKFSDLEDIFILLEFIKISNFSMSEECLYLSIIIQHLFSLGFSPAEAIELLKKKIKCTSPYIQSLVVLCLLISIDSINPLWVTSALDLFLWFAENICIHSNLLWLMLTVFVPFTQKSSLFPKQKDISLKAINLLKLKIKKPPNNDLNLDTFDSIHIKYLICRHETLHQSFLLLRLLSQFSQNSESLHDWLKGFLSVPCKQRSHILLIQKYFLSSETSIKLLCLSIFKKWELDNLNLYLFLIKYEKDPLVTKEIIHTLSSTNLKQKTFLIEELIECLSDLDEEQKFSIKAYILNDACKHGYNVKEELIFPLTEKNSISDRVIQSDLMKTLAFHMNIHFKEVVNQCNTSLQIDQFKDGDLATSLIIDTINIMCEKKVLNVAIIWDDLFKIVAGESHPALHISVCNFLSNIPSFLSKQDYGKTIIYKSARVLWYLAKNPCSIVGNKYALRALESYDLEIFDSTFLDASCLSHTSKSHDQFTSVPIKGACWLHLMRGDGFVNLFVHYINKSKPACRGVYASLFDGVVKFLTSCDLKEEDMIKNSLIMMSADWISIPEGISLHCLRRFMSTAFREDLILCTLKLSRLNDSAANLLDTLLLNTNLTDKEKSILCVLPGNYLHKYRESNEDLLFQGYLFFVMHRQESYFSSGEVIDKKIEIALTSFTNNSEINVLQRRTVMKILIKLWLVLPSDSEGFKWVSDCMINIYGYSLLKYIPVYEEHCDKCIFLCTQMAIKSKLLKHVNVNIGLTLPSCKPKVLESLLHVLRCIGNENQKKNIKWILRILCRCSMESSNFLCQILIYGMNYLSGAYHFITDDSLKSHFICFPLAIETISRITGRGENICLTLNSILQNSKLSPAFIEAFKLSILRIQDNPDLSFQNVTLKCI